MGKTLERTVRDLHERISLNQNPADTYQHHHMQMLFHLDHLAQHANREKAEDVTMQHVDHISKINLQLAGITKAMGALPGAAGSSVSKLTKIGKLPS